MTNIDHLFQNLALMIPIRFKVTKKEGASFHIQVNEMPYQYDQWHYHPEYQISLILKGSGIISIGDSMEEFGPNSMYVIAPNVPHVFKNKSSYFEQPATANTHMISLFFLPTAFGGQFLQLPEMVKVNEFLHAAAKGVRINPSLTATLKPLIFELMEAKGAKQLINLLEVLNQIALSPQKEFLSSIPYHLKVNETDSTLNKIFNYISTNFDQQISLEEVSKIAHLNKYAFCRYFKKITHKSFIAYLNEFRISMACKFLIKETYSISQIGFLVGYNNISNFYRQFKKIMKMTPSKYIELYGKAL